jgi:hypothetical protein
MRRWIFGRPGFQPIVAYITTPASATEGNEWAFAVLEALAATGRNKANPTLQLPKKSAIWMDHSFKPESSHAGRSIFDPEDRVWL